MKLKLISDGTNIGTKLINEDTGEAVSGISQISWEAKPEDPITKVVVEFFNIPVEIATKADVDLFEFTEANNWEEPIYSKSFEKDIIIKSELKNSKAVLSHSIKIINPETNEQSSGVQSIKWTATPESRKAKIQKINFDKKDW
jgi:hypothetical protein